VQGFTALANRFATEFQSNAPSADIVIQGQGLTSGLLGQYYQPFPDFKFRDVYPEAFPYPNKSKAVAFPLTQNAVVLIHNTEVVKEADAPKGWLALADPAWKGKFVIHDPRQLTTPTSFFAEMFLVLGQDRWNTYMRDVAANAPTLVGSSTEAYVKVVSGEFPVGLALINDILNQKPGTPVRIAYPTEEPIGLTIVPSTFIGISQKAASPNFAKLFAIWALSPPGQRAVGDTGRMPTLSILDHPLSPGKVIPPGVKPFPVNPEIVTNPKKWGDLMKSFFG
jgi:iron(III) transport system substrate-binding protein